MGQPLAIVVATSRSLARKAASLVHRRRKPLAIIDAREAATKGDFIFPPRTIACGDVLEAFFKMCLCRRRQRIRVGKNMLISKPREQSLAIDGRRKYMSFRVHRGQRAYKERLLKRWVYP